MKVVKELRFILVGILNTIFGYGIYALFIYVGIQYFWANTLSYILGISHSYLWNKFYTFRSDEKSLKEILRFVSVYLISYCFSTLCLAIFVGKMHIDPYLAGAGTLFFTTLISYIGHNFFSFKERKTKS